MRILQIGPLPSEVGGKSAGGVASHVWDLSRHLNFRGHQVAVLADNCKHEEANPIINEDIIIYGTKGKLKFKMRRNIFDPEIFFKAIRLKMYFGVLQSWRIIFKNLIFYREFIEDFNPDIIHIHHLEKRFPYTFSITGRDIPIITTVHSSHSFKMAGEKYCKRISALIIKNLKLSKYLIFVSDFVRKQYENKFSNELKECRYEIIYNPVDSSKYYPIQRETSIKHLSLESNKRYILFVGGLIARKGVNLLIDSAEYLIEKYPYLVFLIVGEGPLKESLCKRINKRNNEDNIRLEGVKKYPELLYYYNSADLFVLPSLSEGFSISFLEAMLCGCPIIGRKGVAEESVSSEDYGLLFDPGDVDGLSKVIEKGLGIEWNSENIIKNAKSFDWRKRVVDFENTYKHIFREDGYWNE